MHSRNLDRLNFTFALIFLAQNLDLNFRIPYYNKAFTYHIFNTVSDTTYYQSNLHVSDSPFYINPITQEIGISNQREASSQNN